MATRKAKDKMSAGSREQQIRHLAETTDLSPKQAGELLDKYGDDWERIRKEAETYRAES